MRAPGADVVGHERPARSTFFSLASQLTAEVYLGAVRIGVTVLIPPEEVAAPAPGSAASLGRAVCFVSINSSLRPTGIGTPSIVLISIPPADARSQSTPPAFLSRSTTISSAILTTWYFAISSSAISAIALSGSTAIARLRRCTLPTEASMTQINFFRGSNEATQKAQPYSQVVLPLRSRRGTRHVTRSDESDGGGSGTRGGRSRDTECGIDDFVWHAGIKRDIFQSAVPVTAIGWPPAGA